MNAPTAQRTLADISPPIYQPECLFTVYGPPVPCGRPRATVIPSPKGSRAHVYADPKSVKYQKLIGEVALRHRPPSWRSDWASYSLWVRVYLKEDRGDCDNFLKSVSDGCNRILWDNDKRIRSWRIDIAEDHKNPRVEVLAMMVGDIDADKARRVRTRTLAKRRNGRS